VTISNRRVGEWYARTRSVHNYRTIIDKVVSPTPSWPPSSTAMCTVICIIVQFNVAAKRCGCNDALDGGALAFEKSARLSAAGAANANDPRARLERFAAKNTGITGNAGLLGLPDIARTGGNPKSREIESPIARRRNNPVLATTRTDANLVYMCI